MAIPGFGVMKALGSGKRRSLLHLISDFPGLHFREIQRRSELSNGQLIHHLGCLQDARLIKTVRSREFQRYYSSDVSSEEAHVLGYVRQRSERDILLHLLNASPCIHRQIVEHSSLSPSTVTWHLTRLVEGGIVEKRILGKNSLYAVRQPELIVRVLTKYKESFSDRLVNRFVDMWEL